MNAALFNVAVRGMVRQPRRTALTLAAVVLGVAASIFTNAFIGGFLDLIVGIVVEGRLGAIQVHAPGFLDAETRPLQHDLVDESALVQRLRAVPGVRGVTRRITFEAMLSNGNTSTMVMVTAVDPRTELDVCPNRWNGVDRGAYRPRPEGEPLVGRILLEGLQAQKGDVLTLLASTRRGTQGALEMVVGPSLGVTDPLQSKRGVEVPLAFAQELLGMEGRVTQYALSLERGVDVKEVAARIKAEVGPAYDVRTWLDLMPEVADAVDALSVILAFVVGLLGLLVLSAIANTILMSVHERTREIGMMMAMGMRRRDILRSFVMEAGVLGAVGGVIGAILGAAIVLGLQVVGFPMRPPESEIDNYLRPVMSVPFSLFVVVCAWLGAMLAAIYPARRAAALTPVEALRND